MSSRFRILRCVDYFPSTFPLNAVFSPRERSPEHGHDFVEIVLIVGGRGMHVHRNPKGRATEYEIVENDVLVVPVGWTHAYKDTHDLDIYNIIYAPSLIARDFIGASNSAGAFGLFSGRRQHTAEGLVYKVHLRHSVRQAAESVVKSIRREVMTRRHGYEMLAKARLLELLTLLERASDDRPADTLDSSEAQGPGPHRGVAGAIRFVEDHYVQPIGLQDIADAVALNPNYLCERFGQVTGISPVKYLTRLRIEHAKGLLLTTELSVTDAALHSGFSDSSYFTRVFRATEGRTPSAFRKAVRLL